MRETSVLLASTTSSLPLTPLLSSNCLFLHVYRGKWHGTPVAIKRLKQQNLTEEVLDDFKKELAILAYFSLFLFSSTARSPTILFAFRYLRLPFSSFSQSSCRKLRHPNIVMFIGACTQPAHLFIITGRVPSFPHLFLFSPFFYSPSFSFLTLKNRVFARGNSVSSFTQADSSKTILVSWNHSTRSPSGPRNELFAPLQSHPS